VTTAQLEAAHAELVHEIAVARSVWRSWPLPSMVLREQQLRAALETARAIAAREQARQLAAREAADRAAAATARRAALRQVLAPVQGFRRPWIARLVDGAVSICVAHQIDVRFSNRDFCDYGTRTAHVGRVLSEAGFAALLHEIGHLVDAAADGRQHRHVRKDDGFLVAPAAECAAWRRAIELTRAHNLPWTQEMHGSLASSLATYQPHATADERVLIAETIRSSAQRVAPAPDSFEARTRRVATIRRQDRLAAIQRQDRARRQHLAPRREARQHRLSALGLA
jgi:hypothetical protein